MRSEEFSIHCSWKWIKPSNAKGRNIQSSYEYDIINVDSVLPFGIPKIWSFGFLCQMNNDPIHRQIINRMNKNKEFSWKKDYFSSFQELLKVWIKIDWLLNRNILSTRRFMVWYTLYKCFLWKRTTIQILASSLKARQPHTSNQNIVICTVLEG